MQSLKYFAKAPYDKGFGGGGGFRSATRFSSFLSLFARI